MIRFRFRFHERPDWPVLAWVARMNVGDGAVNLFHGSRVELSNEWACEAVWDGEFSRGDFDKTDLIFGSGVRVRNNKLLFVSSGTTVDRLVYCELQSGTRFVSNSLVALAAITDSKLDVTYPYYFEDFVTCGKGIDYCKGYIETSNPRLNQIFFRNLAFDGVSLTVEDKLNESRSFVNFEQYY